MFQTCQKGTYCTIASYINTVEHQSLEEKTLESCTKAPNETKTRGSLWSAREYDGTPLYTVTHSHAGMCSHTGFPQLIKQRIF